MSAERAAPSLEQAVGGPVGWRAPGEPTLFSVARDIAGLTRATLRQRRRWPAMPILAAIWNVWHFSIARHFVPRVECPFCGWSGPAFIALANDSRLALHSRCPGCDSRSRHRGLFQTLTRICQLEVDGPILVFAPEMIVLDRLRTLTQRPILTTDYNAPGVDYPGEDIQALTFATASVAAIVCNHVLEHVPDDDRALAECARVLVQRGVALFTIPGDYDQQDTTTYDRPEIVNGHHRHYGLDVVDKMARQFSTVEVIDMGKGTPDAWRVRHPEYLFLCTK